MAHYLLIHGSWHGAWCWHKVAPRLEAMGHKVTVPDLLGRIRNPAKPLFVSLKAMLNDIERLLSSDKKTIIVVHSRYGILASQIAEKHPDKVEQIIYIASFMIPTGKRVAEYFRLDKQSLLGPFIEISKSGMWDYLRPEIYREALYHDCREEDNALGTMLLGREPLRPALAKLKLTDDSFGRVKKSYIRLTEDRAVSPYLQDHLLGLTQVDRVESLKASHSAYFSKPDALTETIVKLSRD